jgi:hypothetical protein
VVHVQTDGKIVLAGSSFHSAGLYQYSNFALVRYLGDETFALSATNVVPQKKIMPQALKLTGMISSPFIQTL